MIELPDFDELLKLAKEDPQALESLRKTLVDQVIERAPEKHQRRLRGLQFQVDAERQKAKNPTDACIRISRMMHDSFSNLRSTLLELQDSCITKIKETLTSTGALKPPPPPKAPTAQIINFKPE